MTAAKLLSGLGAGLLFGAGLAISGMTNPNKVLNFLDLTGPWDPSLGLVMAAAVPMSALAFWMAKLRRRHCSNLASCCQRTVGLRNPSLSARLYLASAGLSPAIVQGPPSPR